MEVPLRSRAGGGGPARPTAFESWQLRSGEAHCVRELAVEVRRPTAIKSWQMRSGEEGRKDGRKEGRTTRRRSRASDIKSNNPHLAGGEK